MKLNSKFSMKNSQNDDEGCIRRKSFSKDKCHNYRLPVRAVDWPTSRAANEIHAEHRRRKLSERRLRGDVAFGSRTSECLRRVRTPRD